MKADKDETALEELVKRASAAYWFLVDNFPARSGYIDPLKPAIEAVTGKKLERPEPRCVYCNRYCYATDCYLVSDDGKPERWAHHSCHRAAMRRAS